jgi:hypothetical protein
MAKFKLIDESKAPARLATTSVRRRAEYDGYVSQVVAQAGAQVGELTPDASETTLALAVRIGVAAKRVGAQLDMWTHEGKVYFSAKQPKAAQRSSGTRWELGKSRG